MFRAGLGTADRPATFVVQGGYFSTSTGVDAFSRGSLKAAIDLQAFLLNANPENRVHLALLVNDIGDVACGTMTSCTLSERATVVDSQPATQEAAALLKEHGVTDYRIFTEKSLKNRGLRRIKKLRNNRQFQSSVVSVASDEAYTDYFFRKDGEEIALFRERGTSWAAKCPVIKAMFNTAAVEWAHGIVPASGHIVVVDFAAWSDSGSVHKGPWLQSICCRRAVATLLPLRSCRS